MNCRRFLIAILLLAYPACAWGNEFRLMPSMSVKEDYNSNILLSTDSKKSDFITTLSPGVEMVDNTDRLDTDLLLRLDRLEYAGSRDLSTTNQMYDGKFQYRATPLLTISGEAGYTRNANPTLNIDTTGFVTVPLPWHHITSSLTAWYQLSEKAAAAVSYSYGRDYYSDPRFLGDVTHAVNAGLVYDFGQYFPALKGRMNAGYSKYSFPGTVVDNAIGTVGFSQDFDETWNVAADGGVSHTSSDVSITQYVLLGYLVSVGQGIQIIPVYQSISEELKNEGWGWTGDVSLNYKGERSSGSLTYTRDVIPAYGLNGAAEQNALALSAQYQLTYELSALFSSGYYSLKPSSSGSSTQVINQHTFRINPAVRYEFSKAPLKIITREKDMAIEASYEYTLVDYPASNKEAARHLFSIRLYMQNPFFE